MIMPSLRNHDEDGQKISLRAVAEEQNLRCSLRICGKTTGRIEHPEAAAKSQTILVLGICLLLDVRTYT